MSVTASRDKQACCSAHALNNALNQQACLLHLHLTTGTSVTIKLDEHACLLEMHLPADMFELVTTDYLNKHICSCVAEPTCIMLHLPQPADMSLCSYPTNGLVITIPPDHHACILQLHLTSSHVFIRQSACMSATVSSYKHPCILHLHSTISHVCNNCTSHFPCL